MARKTMTRTTPQVQEQTSEQELKAQKEKQQLLQQQKVQQQQALDDLMNQFKVAS